MHYAGYAYWENPHHAALACCGLQNDVTAYVTPITRGSACYYVWPAIQCHYALNDLREISSVISVKYVKSPVSVSLNSKYTDHKKTLCNSAKTIRMHQSLPRL